MTYFGSWRTGGGGGWQEKAGSRWTRIEARVCVGVSLTRGFMLFALRLLCWIVAVLFITICAKINKNKRKYYSRLAKACLKHYETLYLPQPSQCHLSYQLDGAQTGNFAVLL
jgi:hypothetical protein